MRSGAGLTKSLAQSFHARHRASANSGSKASTHTTGSVRNSTATSRPDVHRLDLGRRVEPRGRVLLQRRVRARLRVWPAAADRPREGVAVNDPVADVSLPSIERPGGPALVAGLEIPLVEVTGLDHMEVRIEDAEPVSAHGWPPSAPGLYEVGAVTGLCSGVARPLSRESTREGKSFTPSSSVGAQILACPRNARGRRSRERSRHRYRFTTAVGR